MELGAVDVAPLNDGGKLLAVFGRREREVGHRRREAVHEVDVVATCDVIEERRWAAEFELIPAHVRYRQAAMMVEATHATGQHSQALDFTFFRRLEQQLHADADS